MSEVPGGRCGACLARRGELVTDERAMRLFHRFTVCVCGKCLLRAEALYGQEQAARYIRYGQMQEAARLHNDLEGNGLPVALLPDEL